MKLGKVYKKFKSKKGNEIILRTPKWEDLNQCVRLVNKISKEDTFVSFSGEKIKKDEEMEWLSSAIQAMEKKEALHLFAFIKGKMVGNCEFKSGQHRNINKHVGNVGIMIDEDFRDEGIGTEMLKALIREAPKYKMKILQLGVFGNNKRALYTYERLGFKKCGTIPGAILHRNKYVDEVLMFQEIK